ncbi:MAG: hypothetical protein AAGN82_29260, partial [Myxococcota bacterium]
MNRSQFRGAHDWTVDAPPEGFAERCVEAMLHEAAAPSRRPWLRRGTWLILAAALCGSTAWATSGVQAAAARAPVDRFVRTLPRVQVPAAPKAPPPVSVVPASPAPVERVVVPVRRPLPPSRAVRPPPPSPPSRRAELPTPPPPPP